MKRDDFILLLAGLGGVAAIVALTAPLIWTMIQPKPIKPTGKPTAFVYDYPWGELAGERHWSQVETGGWREVYPDGKTVNYFKEVRREKLERCGGTVVEREDGTNFKILIADRDCEKMWLFYQIGDGAWNFMGAMKSVK
ncbi:hypothetical protein ACIPM0_03590 [Pseudomonas sichuanensis]|uniref:hypothetical protein n=1 Tax=Pseudomonas TaxID=286 RepID=UPI003806A851